MMAMPGHSERNPMASTRSLGAHLVALGEQHCGEVAADRADGAGRSGHEDRAVVCGFHYQIAGLKLSSESFSGGRRLRERIRPRNDGGACYAYFSAISMPSGASGPTGMKSKSIRPAWPSGRPCTWVLAASTDSAFTTNTTPEASSLNHICSMTPSR